MDVKKTLTTGSWLVGLVGFGVLTWAVTLAFGGRVAGRFPLPFDSSVQEGRVSVSTDQHVQVTVEMTVTGSSVQEKTEPGKKEKEYQLRYRFPLQYTLQDPSGRSVQTEKVDIAWDAGSRQLSDMHVSLSGGSLHLKSSFTKFRSDSRDLVLKASVGPDTSYLATATNGSIVVYDQISDYGMLSMAGLLLLIGGWVTKRVANAYHAPVSPKKRLVAFVLCLLLGGLGVHRFYVGKKVSAVLMIFTAGGLGLWYLSDMITILVGAFLDKEGKRLVEWT